MTMLIRPAARTAAIALTLVLLGGGTALYAQPSADSPSDAKPAETNVADDPAARLVLEQEQLSDRFKRLEEVMLRLAELTAPNDPRRAELLLKAVRQGKEELLGLKFARIVELLQKDRLKGAADQQDELAKGLNQLLDLLLSEDREKRVKSEQARIKEYLKRINNLIKSEKAVQGQTEQGGNAKRLADQQEKIADKTGELADDIDRDEQADRGDGEPSADGESKEGESGKDGKEDEKPKDAEKGQPSEGEGQQEGDEQQSKQGEGQQGEGKPKEGEQGENQQGQPSDGQQGEGQQGQQGQPQEQNPAQKRLEAAEERMREAQEHLEQAERDEAVEEQQKALAELEQAKAELEEILRQLREEELERMLAYLEARFRKMLEMQLEVYAATEQLDKIPEDDRERSFEIDSGRLSREESRIVAEADNALALLREEGSAVAFPEAVMQMREDMEQVVVRLARTQVGALTQGIEEDIIAALEELIEALQKAQKELEQKQAKPQPAQSPSDDPALIDMLAELKMLRSLQMRVNRRTQRYSALIDGDQAEAAELLEALAELSERQERIHRATRDIAVGRNE